ncbi:conjugal transfer protein TraN [Nitrosophilus labii]|uniref:conjugal transfer protein TraN n=1 Tax=Nitrosophilus labii TaxID=2706014 RepID=UPI00165732CB|nr:conjugal transfer protein TraN [Nitrosophilus labii]
MFFNKLKLYIGLLPFIAVSNVNAIICSDYGDFKLYNGHYYTITKNKMTFNDAKTFAENSGGYLAIPDNQAENDFIKSLLPNATYGWIGIWDPQLTSNYCYDSNCAYDDSRFITVKGTTPVYTNWAPYQPDNLVKSNDIIDGVEKISPLGEHWVAIASPGGQWADMGNHFDEYNNPARYYGIFEFDTMPECYQGETNITDSIEGKVCNTKIYDSGLDLVTDGQTFDCQTDQYGTDFCPSGLAECGSEWEYMDGYSEPHIGTTTETYQKIRVWTGRIGDNYWSGSCAHYSTSAYFNITDLDKVIEFKLKRTKFDDWIKVTVNGHIVRVGPYGGDMLEVVYSDGTNTYSSYAECNDANYGYGYCGQKVQYTTSGSTGACELSTSWNQYHNIDAKQYLIEGTNVVRIDVIVAGGGEGYAYFEGIVGQGVFNCTGGYCSVDDIGTTEITTNYTYYEYLCQNDPNEYGENWEPIDPGGPDATDPTPPPDNCRRETFTCVPAPDRKCAWVDNKWQCSPYPCISGNDIVTTDTPVGINDADNNGWDDSGNCMGQIYIFNGYDNRCRSEDIFFGLAGGGCCDKDKVFFGLIQCKDEEMKLAKLRNEDRCHYIGEYCSKEVELGFTEICVQHKQTYCCFNSKLARIINEQGRTQINKNWGEPKNPNCKGFTPEEFQKLDFSKIDMSEFFNDVTKTFNSSFIQNQANFIQDRINTNLSNIQN